MIAVFKIFFNLLTLTFRLNRRTLYRATSPVTRTTRNIAVSRPKESGSSARRIICVALILYPFIYIYYKLFVLFLNLFF